jgi:hypothetical protein
MSVAIRAATRIQDMDDANVTLGVGVDEYVLTYDHDTAKFVLRAPVAAPDLSGYALLAGRAGGQTLYGGTAANDDITIHGTSNATRTTSYVLLQPTSGNVGIGTTSPGAKLDVNGNLSSVYIARFANNASWGNGIEVITVDVASMNNIYAHSEIIGSDFVVKANGYVGIGTTIPATALHVVGAATITGGIRPAADSTTALQLQNVAGTSVLNVDTTNARVGIGTTTPGYLLQSVSAGAGASEIVASNTAGVERIHFISRSSAGVSYIQSQNSQLLVGTYDNFAVQLLANNVSRVMIDTSGNVGINDVAPAEALDVTGNINTTGVYKVDDVQVLSNRVIDARCADVANSGDATTDGLIDALRDAMIAHGLIAAA